MSFESVNDILDILQKQAQWQEQPLQLVLKIWAEVVGVVANKHTRPLSIQRDVLWVATSSAAWAQNLTFKRQTLLLTLNGKLSICLVDIRFSTAGWKSSPEKVNLPTKVLPSEHPSYVADATTSKSAIASPHANNTDINNANTAFGRWAKLIQTRSQSLPLCPQCQSPTPPGELQRWQICAFCAAKQL
ncbi:DUF721 domain-containing protein [Calothrix sp. FACHB-1219]|uniref:DUF721 domain-containing protein n=1 Tax=unclassified Calothrix TaxID=2619626 RepID=UPI00168854D5|nr:MULTISPECIES: DciA family protein [unclassified Calothrix]MBD2202337.1 DUF721 domain-containing protein [Calothrix sp. FACHB-168]MBD2217743.1 DUF721 domain-containing protein [Calothrix sp. FACHB-1219]